MRRRHRLRHRADFDSLRRNGRRWHHPLVILIVNANGHEQSRFGFSASRRIGKAIQRNRAKRLMREAVRRHLDEIESGWDCLFVARRLSDHIKLVEIEAGIVDLLQRAALMTRPDPRQH